MSQYYNFLTEAPYEMSALEKDILYLLMCELRHDDPPHKKYVIDIGSVDILRNASIDELTKAATNLITRVYNIKKPK